MHELILSQPLTASIQLVTLNRPDRRNALSIELLTQLGAELAKLSDSQSCRAVILNGAGPVFTSGLEMREVVDPQLTADSASQAAAVMQQIRVSPLIMIAAVHGGAWAGGAALMASCDIVVATPDAQIAFPAARRGVVPSLILDLIRFRVGDGNLRDLFLTGLPADAATAQRMGLVQRVVPQDQLMTEARTVAEAIVAGGPQTIRDTKALLNDALPNSSDSHDTLQSGIRHHLEAQHTTESQEGLAAFLERRRPWWAADE